MKQWSVNIWTQISSTPISIEVDAEDQWRAVLAAGRTGKVPLDVREIAIRPLPDAPRAG